MATAPLPKKPAEFPNPTRLRAVDDPPPAMSPPRREAARVEMSPPAPSHHAALALVLLVLAAVVTGSAGLTLVACGIFLFLAAVFFGTGVARVIDLARQDEPAGLGAWLRAIALAVAGPILAFGGALLTLLSTMSFARGRQLRRLGRVRLPPVEDGAAWTGSPTGASAPQPLRAALAAQWRENGRTEHASVAAFARLTLDLVALGAPPRLIEAAHRDALDEIRHAEICFGIARDLDGRERSPSVFAEAGRARRLPRLRSFSLAKLAVDSMIDGALNEGTSARVIAQLARRCEDPATRDALRRIAADEGRHSAHGWDVVAWCLAEGGAPVAHALRGAVSALPHRLSSSLPEAARDGSWERHGIPGEALESEHFLRSREHVAQRIARWTSAHHRRAVSGW